MYILKLDLPSGVAYFTGKKRIVQGTESPGLTGDLAEARGYDDQEEAARFCKMLIRKYDLEFYITEVNDFGTESAESDAKDRKTEEELSVTDFREYNFVGRNG